MRLLPRLGLGLLAVVFLCQLSAASAFVLKKEQLGRLKMLEDSMVVMADSMAHCFLPDSRIDYCVRFTKHLKQALEIPGSIDYPFARLDSFVHIVVPEDKSFRIFNWLIKPSETVRRYYGAIQVRSEEPVFFPLKDRSEQLEKSETATLANDQWYGCELYKIMQQEVDGQKMYLLFGFNSNGATSNKKILDVLYFDNGKPFFGAPIFEVPDARGQRLQSQSRFVLEYKKTAQIYLNYDAERKMIIYNRLISEVTDPNRKNTYIPTGQLDGLRYENGRFIYVKDAVPILKLRDGQAPIDGVMSGG
ncbi:MAG: hypothetical protein QM642_06090 [Edaphocola sp.]